MGWSFDNLGAFVGKGLIDATSAGMSPVTETARPAREEIVMPTADNSALTEQLVAALTADSMPTYSKPTTQYGSGMFGGALTNLDTLRENFGVSSQDLYDAYGNGMDREQFDELYQAAREQVFDGYQTSGMDASANNMEAVQQLKPVGMKDGKVIYSLFSTAVFTGNPDRVSYVYQGWQDEDWITEQARAGKITLTTYTDPLTGKEVQGLAVDPETAKDENFAVEKVGGYRGANTGRGTFGFGAGLEQFFAVGAAVLTAGASLGAGALAAEGATIGTAAGFEAGSAAAGAVTGAATGAMATGIAGGNIIEGAVIGGVTGAVTAPNGIEALTDVKNTLGAYAGGGAVVQKAVDATVNGAVGGFVTGAVTGGWGDALEYAGIGAVTAGVGTYVGGTAAEWAEGTGFENTVGGAAGGAAAGATGAALTGNDVLDGALIGGAVGGIGGGLIDMGASDVVAGTVKSAVREGVTDLVTDDGDTGTTSTNTTTTTTDTTTDTDTTQQGLGFGFSSALPQYQKVTRRNMNWGSRLA